MANAQQSEIHAFRCGSKTFKFRQILPYPNSDHQLQPTLGNLVQAGVMIHHDETMGHHGDCVFNAAYALFDHVMVDNMIRVKEAAWTGVMNGTGGMGGAVVLFMRATMNMNSVLGRPQEGRLLKDMADHIFERREIERAIQEVIANP